MNGEAFWPGDRVLVFDSRRFRDDVSTPLSVTMRPASVVRWYGRRSPFGGVDASMIDVVFDGETRESCGHFTDHVPHL